MGTSLRYRLDILPGEVVLAGAPIVIHFDGPILSNSLGGVGVKGQPAKIHIADDSLSVTVDTSNLPVGAHTLAIQGVTSLKEGERLGNSALSFLIVQSPARIPADLAVIQAARLRFGKLGTERLAMRRDAEVPWIDVFKAIDRKSGKPIQLAFDQTGNTVELDGLLESVSKRRAKLYGRCHPTLFETVQKSDPASPVPVAVWLLDTTPNVLEKSTKGATKRPVELEKQANERWYKLTANFIETAVKVGFESKQVDKAAPIVYGSVPAGAVMELARREDVAGIFLHEREGFVDLTDSIAIANTDDAHTAGFSGAGVNVAVYEEGPSDLTNLVISGQFDTTPPASTHARLTSAIIRNAEAGQPHGHAPDCNLFSANSWDLDAVRWAVQDQLCTVVSQSFHRDSEQTSDTLSFDDIYKDNLALHWPYPTICHAAGNGSAMEFVNHKGFNTLTVGSHDDSAGAMASDTVFRNPASTHGDRELPELAANGIGVTAVGLTDSGTSFAAPAVAGAAAVIQSANATLQSWPEGCRAILLASSWRNPGGGTWRADLVAGIDARDGSGALDTQAALQIARSRRSKTSAGTQRGWDVGTIYSAVVDAGGLSTFRYQISVPVKLRSPRVKVALAWDSKITTLFGLFLTGSSLTVDLDLRVTDANGVQVASSASWNNSYEIAEFDAIAGQTYEIRIRRWSGTDDVWYGVAWTVTGLPLFRDLGALGTGFQLGTR